MTLADPSVRETSMSIDFHLGELRFLWFYSVSREFSWRRLSGDTDFGDFIEFIQFLVSFPKNSIAESTRQSLPSLFLPV